MAILLVPWTTMQKLRQMTSTATEQKGGSVTFNTAWQTASSLTPIFMILIFLNYMYCISSLIWWESYNTPFCLKWEGQDELALCDELTFQDTFVYFSLVLYFFAGQRDSQHQARVNEFHDKQGIVFPADLSFQVFFIILKIWFAWYVNLYIG